MSITDKLKKLSANMKALDDKEVIVGIFGDPRSAKLALWHEYGTVNPPNIQAKRFIRNGKKDSQRMVNQMIRNAIKGKTTPDEALNDIGNIVVGSIQGTIDELEPYTLPSGYHNPTPAFETGVMRGAFDYLIEDK